MARSVAPGNPYLGAMLPYAPLHHLLMADLGRAVVATSGNLTDEPICIDEREALDRLHGIADLFLVHDRPIIRHVDDSIVRIVAGREMVLRRARGYAPLPTLLPAPIAPTLAVGAQLKNAIALSVDRSVFISQHIGDLETAEATEAFERVIDAFRGLYGATPARVFADLHPDYRSTRYAQRLGVPVTHVQHHFAHVAACMAENGLDDPVLGVAWDGTGYGPDGTVWGGEFLVPSGDRFDRVATLRPFRLPGGERAVRQPWRSAFSLLHALYGDAVADAPATGVDRREAGTGSSAACHDARQRHQLAADDERGAPLRCRRLAVRPLSRDRLRRGSRNGVGIRRRRGGLGRVLDTRGRTHCPLAPRCSSAALRARLGTSD